MNPADGFARRWALAMQRRVRNTVQVCNDTALLLALATTPGTWSAAWRARLSQQVVSATLPQLPWFTVLAALIGLVLIRIVVVTAHSYGLSQFALEMVVRVLVLELLPLSAALFVALRGTLPMASELRRLQARAGQLAMPLAVWLTDEVLPRALAGMFAVMLLMAISGVVALVLAYLMVHGVSPWGLEAYTRMVGRVFSPAVALVCVLKTLAFALAVGAVPLVSVGGPARPAHGSVGPAVELVGLVRTTAALLLVEVLSLVGNYY
ncbi:MAG TPA: ABC transporter permease [Burkholderiaceae bacterium]|nr:ABC transporter permease [Burkholderiaceae bacterium]